MVGGTPSQVWMVVRVPHPRSGWGWGVPHPRSGWWDGTPGLDGGGVPQVWMVAVPQVWMVGGTLGLDDGG